MNCEQEHKANSKECKICRKDKEIFRIKYTQNLSFPEARKIVESKTLHITQSYASVAKVNSQSVKLNHNNWPIRPKIL